MLILAIDTCLAACSVAVTRDGVALAAISEPMMRGHQERLAPMVREAMTAAGVAFDNLNRVAVTVGPGSFTGLRVGIAFAKGVGAALSIPVVGVETLEALCESAGPPTIFGNVIPVIDAKRGCVYAQLIWDSETYIDPGQFALADIHAYFVPHLRQGDPIHLVGPGGTILGPLFPGASIDARPAPDPVTVAHLASGEPAGDGWLRPPTPLYLRAPDAKLPGGRDLPS